MQEKSSSASLVRWVAAASLVLPCASLASADTGTIDTVAAFESQFVGPRRVDIWLPDDYSADSPPMQVIYAQDGQNLFRSKTAAYGGNEWGVDETVTRLVRDKKIRPAIVVGIWNSAKRFLEYGPEIPWKSLPEATQAQLTKDMKEIFGVQHGGMPLSEDYLKFMVEELKPYIDSKYNTLPDRANTTILGSSMGGLISIYAIARYPEVFGNAMCLSTHWPITIKSDRADVADAIISYLDTALPRAGQHRIYFDFGTETLDAWYEPHQRKMDQVMRAHGFIEGKDWVTRKFEGHEHSEIAWKKRLHIPFEAVLGTVK